MKPNDEARAVIKNQIDAHEAQILRYDTEKINAERAMNEAQRMIDRLRLRIENLQETHKVLEEVSHRG